MTDRNNDTSYYPTVDSLEMGLECNLFTAVPYLHGFRLSEPQVIYQPPSVVALRAAGAIPGAQLVESHSRLPTITLSVEAGPHKGNFRECSSTTVVGYLRAPEREGLEAIAEELQRGVNGTSDQDYWSEEYWRSLQSEAPVGAESMSHCSSFATPKESFCIPLTSVSNTLSTQRRRTRPRRQYDFSSPNNHQSNRSAVPVARPSLLSCDNTSTVGSWTKTCKRLRPSKCTEMGLRRERDARVGARQANILNRQRPSTGAIAGGRPKQMTQRPSAVQTAVLPPPHAATATKKTKPHSVGSRSDVAAASTPPASLAGSEGGQPDSGASKVAALGVSVSSAPRLILPSENTATRPSETETPVAIYATSTASVGPVPRPLTEASSSLDVSKYLPVTAKIGLSSTPKRMSISSQQGGKVGTQPVFIDTVKASRMSGANHVSLAPSARKGESKVLPEDTGYTRIAPVDSKTELKSTKESTAKCCAVM